MYRRQTGGIILKVTMGILLLMLIASYFGEGIATSYAQTRQTPCGGYIRYGQESYGAIPYAGRDCRYRFTGAVGDVVTIRMTKSSYSLDPYLKLLDPNGYIETFDDDSAGNGNSLISNYRLPSRGTYMIVAGSYNNQSAGDFWLSLTRIQRRRSYSW